MKIYKDPSTGFTYQYTEGNQPAHFVEYVPEPAPTPVDLEPTEEPAEEGPEETTQEPEEEPDTGKKARSAKHKAVTDTQNK